MDFRKTYPAYFFAILSGSDPEAEVIAWEERNGFSVQPVKDIGTDAGTIFLYEVDFNRYYTRIHAEDPKNAVLNAQAEASVVARGGAYVTPNYTPPERSKWS